jgi:glutathionyl-hydroquinone reductase
VDPKDKSGEFKRQQSIFRNFISREPGAQFPPEKDRYHLYVSYACPWGLLSLEDPSDCSSSRHDG